MENKNVGFIVLGISFLIVVIILLFNSALKDIIESSCTGEHGLSCPMYAALTKQTYLSIAIAGILVIFVLVMIFTKPEREIVVKRVKERKVSKKIDLSEFRPEEKKVFKLVEESGAIFQAEIIDKLEGSGLVERKRRGMTNVVVIKE